MVIEEKILGKRSRGRPIDKWCWTGWWLKDIIRWNKKSNNERSGDEEERRKEMKNYSSTTSATFIVQYSFSFHMTHLA